MAEVYVLDTSAIFAFTDQEDGARRVESLLYDARATRLSLEASAISLMELYYIALQNDGEEGAARLIGTVKSWSVGWVYPDEQTLLQAGRLKAAYRLSLADALIAALAKLHNAKLVHKDPELLPLAREVSLVTLPLKKRTRRP